MSYLRAPGEPLRLMAVHAHPDDEASKGAASAARYATEGVEVLVVTCTGGEAGDILNPALDTPEVRADIAGVRRREMAQAAEILGVRQVWLGFHDSGYPTPLEDGSLPPLEPGVFGALPLEEATAPLVALVREFRPHVITTYDEKGGYPHPDHIRCHEVSIEAFEAAADPARYPDVGGEPWQAAKLYYHLTFHKRRLLALHDATVAAGLESPYAGWLENWVDKPEDAGRLTTSVRCAEWFEARDRALLAHATQVDPSGRWFAVPLVIQQEAWPTEDYQLAKSFVQSELPEDDLFAGLRDPAEGQDG